MTPTESTTPFRAVHRADRRRARRLFFLRARRIALVVLLLSALANLVSFGDALYERDGEIGTLASLTVGGEATFNGAVTCSGETITYAATIALDFSSKPCKTVATTGDLTITTSNLAAGRTVTLSITNAASNRLLTFPAWTWISDTPTTIGAGGAIDCLLYSKGTTDAAVDASCGAGASVANASTASGTLPLTHGGTGNANGTGLLAAYTVKTSGASITTSATTHQAYVVVCGGGGGGGGTTTAAASAAAGGGGGAGGCVGKLYTALSPSTVYTIAVGAAGTAGSNAGGNGGNGGDSTFTDGVTLITGKGGTGGLGEAAGSAIGGADGGAGGVVGTNGDWNGSGSPGVAGFRLTGVLAESGSGGSCAYGGGGVGSSSTGVGAAGAGHCSGGAGGNVENNSAAVAGGVGTTGIVVVMEFN